MKLSQYQRLSIIEKAAVARKQLREPPMRCPRCDTAVPVDQMLDHMRQRCKGEPGPAAKWVSFAEAKQLGVNGSTLMTWVGRGLVRTAGRRRRKRYLLRDVLALCLR